MTDWHTRFMGLAHHVALWSKDESTKVGAVIVDKDNRIVSLGYNGPPRGVSDEHINREIKLLRTLHAEENAILFARGNADGNILYITHHPCAHCAAVNSATESKHIRNLFKKAASCGFLCVGASG